MAPCPTRFASLPRARRAPVACLGAADPEEIVEVTVRLRRRSPVVADEGPLLPRHVLVRRHGARRRDADAVEAHAARAGLTVVSRSLAERAIVLRGSLGAMCAAFPADVRAVEIDGARYRRRVGDLHVPRELSGVVEGVFGLTNVPHGRPYGVTAGSDAPRGEPARPWSVAEIAERYGFPEGFDGAGECIGLLEFGGGYLESDIDAHFRAIGVPRPDVVAVPVGRCRNAPLGADPRPDVEVALDIQIAGAVAPRARIAVYFAELTERGWIDALSAAIHDEVNRPSVICVCWGWAELDATGRLLWTKAAMEAVNATLEDAAMRGITVVCAAGDDGSSDGVDDARAHVDFPASSPWVLACGGTEVDGGEERVWNDGPRGRGGGGAGGGGVSDVIDRPEWQSDLDIPASRMTGKRGRGVPDVAGIAGGDRGFAIHLAGREVVGVEGTSAVAPLYAGLVARINQALGAPVGHLNPTLYRSPSARAAFHDIVTGDNDVLDIGVHASSPGWDPCTGWGSIDGQRLLAALSRPAPRVSHVEALRPFVDMDDCSIDEIA
jgi:kumamolisin